MSYRCSECLVRWLPYQCFHGACPQCSGGTIRTYDPPDPGATDLYVVLTAAKRRRDEIARDAAEFERFYANREARRLRMELEDWAHGGSLL